MADLRNDNKETLLEESLTVRNFPIFYRLLLQMRFPIRVSGVLELRALLNDTIDKTTPPEDTNGYAEFIEALESAIDSFGITHKHHRERLLTLLTEIRNLHYRHTINSRDREIDLREKLEDNLSARRRDRQGGGIFLVLALMAGAAWVGAPAVHWVVKVVMVSSLLVSWVYYHSLPVLDREYKHLTQELNELLRSRVEKINWKTMIHKLSLILGYKIVEGIEVFNEKGIGPSNRKSTPLN